jgi:hypothetical protein
LSSFQVQLSQALYLTRTAWIHIKEVSNDLHNEKQTIVMKLDDTDFALLAVFLEGFFCGTISVLQTSRPWTKQSNTALPRIGLNSGIFALYLYESKKNARTGNILFYTLCALYVLSFAGFVLDITYVYVTASVSNISANNNDHIF